MRVKIKVNKEGREQLAKQVVNWSHELCEEVVDEAKRLVPVQSGNLRNSILVIREETGSTVEAQEPYALKIERNDPYLRPAFERVLDRIK